MNVADAKSQSKISNIGFLFLRLGCGTNAQTVAHSRFVAPPPVSFSSRGVNLRPLGLEKVQVPTRLVRMCQQFGLLAAMMSGQAAAYFFLL